MELNVEGLDDLPRVADDILQIAEDQKIFMFYGQMGAGKTTLINTLCEKLGTRDKTSSPTFSIVNEYTLEDGSIFHFDFYRLKNQTEAMDFGYEDYFYSGNYCFIEWPEKIPDLWPDNFVKVVIEVLGENKRRISVEKVM
ncbi:tRNA (adenosine(37)-N6)-threonylcarbamoyltransferase complex ATPase subunit type 1 TsaE [Pelobium manganitolerans]|uniref:tRNA (adenosine(37)-N6)-threonylcarbamoyltransferase complex ATPase subunit type 1 TsaE n=1 Tax=Pelobium manganitolerans TaxID=1842495 RepID=UPI003FA34877